MSCQKASSCFDANFSKSSVCGSDVGGAKERERERLNTICPNNQRPPLDLQITLLLCLLYLYVDMTKKKSKTSICPNLAANINKPLFCFLAKSC